MQWADLRTHGDTPHRAFEALCSLLFERWSLREFKKEIVSFYVTGAGGDGGVESIARLADGSAVGLQCKWFREPLQSDHLGQIKDSLSTAAARRKGLNRYLVAVPRNLADGVDARGSTTERQRWEAFVEQAKKDHPKLTVELWDEHRVEELLATVGGEGTLHYWFSATAIDQGRLERLFAQAKAGWLARRYYPDLHQAGEIENEVELRANRSTFPPQWKNWLTSFGATVRGADQALDQLGYVESISGSALLTEARKAFAALVAYVRALNVRLAGPPNPSASVPLDEPTYEIAKFVEWLSDPSRSSFVRPQRDALRRLQEEWNQRPVGPWAFVNLQRATVFLADAGAGKTHACARIVEKALERHEPAVLIRARDFAPGESTWTTILQQSLEESALSLEELLDALLSAARLVDVRTAGVTGKSPQPCRPIIVVDGLDESIVATNWLNRLNELPATLGDRRVVFAATTRGSLVRGRAWGTGLSTIEVDRSDPDLGQVFAAYMKLSNIQAPSVLRWMLGTPLAVRLFAEVFAGKSPEAYAGLQLGLHDLVRRKIELVAEALAVPLGVSADLARPIVTGRLKGFGKLLLANSGSVSNEDTLTCLRGSGGSAIADPLFVLQVLRDRGILLELHSSDPDPLSEGGPRWDFAFETLHSYIVARTFADSPTSDSLPYLRVHPQALIYCIVLQEDAGKAMLRSSDWAEGLLGRDTLEVRMSALALMRRDRAITHQGYVQQELVASMPACRSVLSVLIGPSLRVKDYPYGGQFLLKALAPFSVADRDKFWSGPRDLTKAEGPWGGYGRPTIESQSIARDDSWDSAPLVALLSCWSVDVGHRRYMVLRLAEWAARNPAEVTRLARVAFDTINDPQIVEDLATSIWAAACLEPKADWQAMRALIEGAQWTCAFRHVPTLTFLRCCELFLSLTGGSKAPLTLVIPDVIPIDRGVGDVESEEGYGPIGGDFSWYVVPQALNAFEHEERFEDNDELEHDFDDEWQWVRERETILRALVDGRIRGDATENAKNEARDCLQNVVAERNAPLVSESELSGETTSDGPGAEIPPQGVPAAADTRLPWAHALEVLLADHAASNGLKSLSLRGLAYGYVMARVAELGWSDTLRDADRAIREQYTPETHGSRSPVCSFFEKYLWLALGELRTFLSRRLSIADPRGELSPDRIEDVENPIDRLDFVSCHIPTERWRELIEPQDLQEAWAQQRANEWVRGAKPIAVREVASFTAEAGYLHEHGILMTHDHKVSWMALNGYLSLREPQSQADRLVWLSSLIVPRRDFSLIEDDARAGMLLQRHDLDDAAARLRRRGSYVGPFEALWMSDAEDTSGIPHATVKVQDDHVMRIELFLHPAVANSTWTAPSERTFHYPARALREALGITIYKSGCFYRADRQLVAMHAELKRDGDESLDPPTGHWLLVREEFLLEALAALDSVLVFAMQARTEPGGHLKDRDIGWERIEQRSMIVLDPTARHEPIDFVERSHLPLRTDPIQPSTVRTPARPRQVLDL